MPIARATGRPRGSRGHGWVANCVVLRLKATAYDSTRCCDGPQKWQYMMAAKDDNDGDNEAMMSTHSSATAPRINLRHTTVRTYVDEVAHRPPHSSSEDLPPGCLWRSMLGAFRRISIAAFPSSTCAAFRSSTLAAVRRSIFAVVLKTWTPLWLIAFELIAFAFLVVGPGRTAILIRD